MKKSFLVSALTVIAFALTACGAPAARTAATLVPQTDSAGMTTNYANAIPIESQLLVGTFKLEGTPQAVDAKQASDLVAYWQLLKELTSSGSAAQEEIDATVAAIESAMTPDQLKAISSMQITRQDMFTILREQGGGFGGGGQSQSNASQGSGRQTQGGGNQRNFNFGPAGGFEGGGGGFAGGPGGFGSQQSNSNRSSNSQSTGGNSFTSGRVPSVLIDAVIKLLQDKSQS